MKKKILIISSDNYIRNSLFNNYLKQKYSLKFIRYSGSKFLKNFKLLKIFFLNYDLIFIHWNLWSSFFILKLINLLKKKPIIYDSYTLIYEDYLDNYTKYNSFLNLFYKNIEKFILKNCDGILTDTESHKKKILKLVKYKTKVQEIEVSQKNLKPILKINKESKINLLHAGANRKAHNIPKMIDLINKLPNKIKQKINFTLVTKDYFHKYRNLIKKLNCEKNISLINDLNFNEYLKIIKNSDICMGMFGKTEKTHNTISNFIVTGTNLGKMIITGNTRSAKYYLRNNKGIILLKKPENLNFTKIINKYLNSINFRKFTNGKSKEIFNKHFSIKKNLKKLDLFFNQII